MSEIINLEKRFEVVIEKLEKALTFTERQSPEEAISSKQEKLEDHEYNRQLLAKIENLEKAAKNDANEIDKLVGKLREIFESDYD